MKFFNVHTVEEAFQVIDVQFLPFRPPIVLPLEEALGKVLAEDIISLEDVPPFSRSAVDGYAVIAKDTYGASESLPAFLQVSDSIEMGQEAKTPLTTGQAQSIPTGGMLPPGADAIVMIEHVEDIGGLLNVYRQVSPGENVIRAAEDVEKGEKVMPKGKRLRPQDLGVLAAIGQMEVKVYPSPTIGLLSTGDEIVSPDTKELMPGQIRDINRIVIRAAVEQLGGRVIDGGIVRDDYEEYFKRASQLFEQSDFLILSGGSSVGTRDYTTQVLQALGEPGVLIHGVSVKPGKPTIIGKAQGKPVMGLPGHPASALIIFDLFGRRIIERLQDLSPKAYDGRLSAKISRNIPSAVGRTDYIRVRLEERDGQLWANPVFGKSGLIFTMVESDGIVEIPSQKEGILEGETVQVMLFEGSGHRC
ncbi:molybdopterin molybdotransferase MoeA [Microaerobacter geothermalis]|uniref:molybdopterin molybdotransferase MoeA n=1 Tax=Microaerobacter geothermalis TaxID=674972 RepID=UPI001F320A1E|nr:gephyrin-like molybdotransferase Glp [Microaerobacter geothermalis]MCF6092918.1 molybdopterin molybdotransferase MoeA [Microaerobacter geothermalis]